MKVISNIFYALFVALLLAVAGLLLATMLPVPGNFEVKIVKSGSMEPAIPTGALVVVRPQSSYAVGDVITFGPDTKQKIPTTHRIIEIRSEGIVTKGDANEEADTQLVARGEVIGKVLLSVPYAGFVLDFARQPLGFLLLIGIPAGLVILQELVNIFLEVRKLWKRRDGDDTPRGGGGTSNNEFRYLRLRVMDDIYVPVRTAVALPLKASPRGYVLSSLAVAGILLVSVASTETRATLSYFADLETSVGNIFSAGTWEQMGSPADIVLNEFLPNPDNSANGLNFGNDASNQPLGEWIELYNKGTLPVDVFGWFMTDASGGLGNTHAVITGTNTNTGGTIIPAGGWLVVFMNKPSLNNTGDEIYLYTSTSSGTTLVDSTSYDNPSDACELDPTPGDENSTSTPTGTPGNGPNADCSDNQVSPNKSYARIPDGTGPWVDPIPTPGYENIYFEENVQAAEDAGVLDEPVVATEHSNGGGSIVTESQAGIEVKDEAAENSEEAPPEESAPEIPAEENPAPQDPPTDTAPDEAPAQEPAAPSEPASDPEPPAPEPPAAEAPIVQPPPEAPAAPSEGI